MSDEPIVYCKLCGRPLISGECVWDRGNVARAERLRLALGTEIRYSMTAPAYSARTWISLQLMIAAYGRLGRAAARLAKRDVFWIDAGYAIDAPEEIPAGGCFAAFACHDENENELYVPEQITIRREP